MHHVQPDSSFASIWISMQKNLEIRLWAIKIQFSGRLNETARHSLSTERQISRAQDQGSIHLGKLVGNLKGFIHNVQDIWYLFFPEKPRPWHPGGILNFELGTGVRPEVSTTTL